MSESTEIDQHRIESILVREKVEIAKLAKKEFSVQSYWFKYPKIDLDSNKVTSIISSIDLNNDSPYSMSTLSTDYFTNFNQGNKSKTTQYKSHNTLDAKGLANCLDSINDLSRELIKEASSSSEDSER